jgi:hypothetical protein
MSFSEPGYLDIKTPTPIPRYSMSSRVCTTVGDRMSQRWGGRFASAA